MTIKIPSTTSQYNITKSNQTYILGENSTIDVTGSFGIFADGIHDVRIEIKGQIIQDSMGGAMYTNGRDISVHIAEGGSAPGQGGISMSGPRARFVNDGTLTGGIYTGGARATIINHGEIFADQNAGSGVEMHGPSSKLISTGSIEAGYGITFNETRASIVLGEDSVVTGKVAGIFSSTADASLATRLVNHGTITSMQYAVNTSAGKETIINHGTIEGGIYLGDGNDVFDNRGGTVSAYIQGGNGNDTLITDKASAEFLESDVGGIDTVRSTVTYTLSTNVERLVLIGGKNVDGNGNGDDNTLIGNAGNNAPTGLSGADTFVFGTHSGHDTVTDFDATLDRIDLRKLDGVTSFSDLKNHHMSEQDGNVIISVGGDQLTIENIGKNDFDKADFLI
ncbi:MAG: hemolysin-type calcium-binding repeat family protein [Rhizobium sp.]|nr:hemolysin-type calcium-binding repeat family protein [Rhizobium sp.]